MLCRCCKLHECFWWAIEFRSKVCQQHMLRNLDIICRGCPCNVHNHFPDLKRNWLSNKHISSSDRVPRRIFSPSWMTMRFHICYSHNVDSIGLCISDGRPVKFERYSEAWRGPCDRWRANREIEKCCLTLVWDHELSDVVTWWSN